VLHAIAFAPESVLGGKPFVEAGWAEVSTAVQVSAWSLAGR